MRSFSPAAAAAAAEAAFQRAGGTARVSQGGRRLLAKRLRPRRAQRRQRRRRWRERGSLRAPRLPPRGRDHLAEGVVGTQREWVARHLQSGTVGLMGCVTGTSLVYSAMTPLYDPHAWASNRAAPGATSQAMGVRMRHAAPPRCCQRPAHTPRVPHRENGHNGAMGVRGKRGAPAPRQAGRQARRARDQAIYRALSVRQLLPILPAPPLPSKRQRRSAGPAQAAQRNFEQRSLVSAVCY